MWKGRIPVASADFWGSATRRGFKSSDNGRGSTRIRVRFLNAMWEDLRSHKGRIKSQASIEDGEVKAKISNLIYEKKKEIPEVKPHLILHFL